MTELYKFKHLDRAVLVTFYETGNQPRTIGLNKGTIVTVMSYAYANCYTVEFECGRATIPASFLRKLSPLEEIATVAE